MAELQHAQIRAKLIDEVVSLVDVSDIANHPEVQLESHKLSRAIAVAAARMASDVELSTVAQSLVDGAGDNGIDLIHYDPQTRSLLLIQSKWSSSHSSSIESGEVHKFLQGVQDLVSLKKNRFNSKIQGRWPSIEDALKRLSSVQVIIAYAGSGSVSQDIESKIDEFIKSQNDTSELFSLNFLLKEICSSFLYRKLRHHK